METVNQLVCPVSEERVDENAARVAAGITVLWVSSALFFNSFWLMAVLAADFAIRAFTAGDWSLVRWLARRIVRLIGLRARPTLAAPKKFAALLGTVFCTLIGLGIALQFTYLTTALVAALLVCALLEGLAGFCVGCYVYTYAILPFKKQ
ncbi:DUF4395 domain-containing protein [Hymenobacter sp. ASUV-10]|uniref:DUF4395 domain-containing protein n=1 Tax=Hymenobacter aranciens TaxID=3063996 RepID=A0ABT9BE52_9BACT|nr:DUF4395 domain-containing protein [Hymenobacter sp. ASUV-10]MDO7875979.1 DUF4395 domain-containing protein [Hymenobacter sp. ASUV-10]